MGRGAITIVSVFLLLAASSRAQPLTGPAVLEQNCSGCHTQASPMGGLDLRTRDGMLRGGRRGAAVIPGQAANSLLFQAVEGAGELKMPPGKKLPPEAIAVLRDWIDAGAPWPEQAVNSGPKLDDLWAFQPLRKAQGSAGVDA